MLTITSHSWSDHAEISAGWHCWMKAPISFQMHFNAIESKGSLRLDGADVVQSTAKQRPQAVPGAWLALHADCVHHLGRWWAAASEITAADVLGCWHALRCAQLVRAVRQTAGTSPCWIASRWRKSDWTMVLNVHRDVFWRITGPLQLAILQMSLQTHACELFHYNIMSNNVRYILLTNREAPRGRRPASLRRALYSETINQACPALHCDS